MLLSSFTEPLEVTSDTDGLRRGRGYDECTQQDGTTPHQKVGDTSQETINLFDSEHELSFDSEWKFGQKTWHDSSVAQEYKY